MATASRNLHRTLGERTPPELLADDRHEERDKRRAGDVLAHVIAPIRPRAV
jgi:hypothetical protein